MNGNVIVVEDVTEMADLIAMFLEKEGLRVESFPDAETALERLTRGHADIVVLDINLPVMDGFEFLGHIRKTLDIPVLIVSARRADEDIVAGLGYGADDFMTKPFSSQVLVARVRALLRRARGEHSSAANLIRFGPYVLDRDAFVLRRGNERVPLSMKEYGVLEHLAVNGGKPQTPQAIYDAVWKSQYGDVTTVAVYIQRLRRKLEADPTAPVYIETVYGRGYRLFAEGPAGEEGT